MTLRSQAKSSSFWIFLLLVFRRTNYRNDPRHLPSTSQGRSFPPQSHSSVRPFVISRRGGAGAKRRKSLGFERRTRKRPGSLCMIRSIPNILLLFAPGYSYRWSQPHFGHTPPPVELHMSLLRRSRQVLAGAWPPLGHTPFYQMDADRTAPDPAPQPRWASVSGHLRRGAALTG